MIDQAVKTMPVAIWVPNIGPAEQAYVGVGGYIYAKSARIQATSPDGRIKLDFPSGPLGEEHLDRFIRLKQYGFTVIDVPATWGNEYGRPQDWIESIVNRALEQVIKSHHDVHEEGTTAMYNEALAEEVLTSLNKSFPYPVTLIQLKHDLPAEPSDDVLMTALDALLLHGRVKGAFRRESTSGKRKLDAMANIQITPEGQKHLSAQTNTPAGGVTFHGDQNNVYGNVGAVGSQSSGVVNVRDHWKEIEGETDLHVLAEQLEQLRSELRKTAVSREDDKRVALLADAADEAERGDGDRVVKLLSGLGATAYEVAKGIGTDLLAKVIARTTGIEP